MKKQKRTRQQLKQTAYHEAGHAVIARVLTIHCGRATIKPNYPKAVNGYAIIHDPFFTMDAWEKRGHVRGSEDTVWHARIIAMMAGVEAENILLDTAGAGDGPDREQIAVMSEYLHRDVDWKKLEPRLRAMTRMLVRRHKARIERVAKALLQRTTMSAKVLDKMVARSIDDVRLNAPFLQAAHRQNR